MTFDHRNPPPPGNYSGIVYELEQQATLIIWKDGTRYRLTVPNNEHDGQLTKDQQVNVQIDGYGASRQVVLDTQPLQPPSYLDDSL